ncbi:Response regulator GacA [BD1-7 clade bacterium]|uniref:Response regulator GacA n=1 Tax=BD1-7 clade bacterium TaxID=2029982 RepID=A0A5S9P658_9GAMM|nr:Response regulator GacA [BD1-7 clade bacterium]
MNTAFEIVIAEDNPRDREFLCASLSQYKLHVANNGHEAYLLTKNIKNPFVISDLQMPGCNGIELAKMLWKEKPTARIIFWTHYQDEIYIRSLSSIIPEETVYGYILKTNTTNQLLKAVNMVFSECQCWIDPLIRPVQKRTKQSQQTISDLEFEVLTDIALGLTDDMIANRRYLSKRGVQSRLKSLYAKLEIEHDRISLSPFGRKVNYRSRAVAIALQRGLINPVELASAEEELMDWFNS